MFICDYIWVHYVEKKYKKMMHVPNLKYRKSMHVHNIYKKKKAHRKHRNELTQLLIENFHYKIRSEIC